MEPTQKAPSLGRGKTALLSMYQRALLQQYRSDTGTTCAAPAGIAEHKDHMRGDDVPPARQDHTHHSIGGLIAEGDICFQAVGKHIKCLFWPFLLISTTRSPLHASGLQLWQLSRPCPALPQSRFDVPIDQQLHVPEGRNTET